MKKRTVLPATVAKIQCLEKQSSQEVKVIVQVQAQYLTYGWQALFYKLGNHLHHASRAQM